ncbi:MAG: hypothetical protein C0627_11100 [Sulfurimonas sp.]|nr:MAG: hypothetical protein C0627_11100 [Sulfurimonas sp.]
MTNVLEENPKRYSLVATPKSELEKRRLLEVLPHNLSCTYTGLTKLIATKSDDGQTIYRSKERIRFIEQEDYKVKIECEEYSYFLSTCAFLNNFDFEYSIDSDDSYQLEVCSTINHDILEEILEDISYEPRYIDEELLPSLKGQGRENLMCIQVL